MRSEPTVPSALLSRIRAPFLETGALLIDPPILQPLGVLLDLAGEDMRARLFVVQAEGGAETCLRPDFTLAVARAHLETGRVSGAYFYEGKVFRAAPADSDRPEEVLQIGLEQFDTGGDRPEVDAQIISLAWRAASAGTRDDLGLWLGDVALFSAFVEGLDLNPSLSARLHRCASRPRQLRAELARAGQAADPAPAQGGLAGLLAAQAEGDAGKMLEEVWALAGISQVGGRSAEDVAQRLIRRARAAQAPALTLDQARALEAFLAINAEPAEALASISGLLGAGATSLSQALEAWSIRLDHLAKAGVPLTGARFATHLGQAFNYYDGLTFEIRSQALGSDRPVAVGGRYDSLPTRLGASGDVRAVGCMVRPHRAYSEGVA